MLGYKVIHRAGGRLVSLADPRQSSLAKVGATMRMPGAGLFLSTNRDFVLAYYSDPDEELAPGVEEVLLTLSFEPRGVLSGNVEDREPVLTVRSARIVAIEPTRHRNPVYAGPMAEDISRKAAGAALVAGGVFGLLAAVWWASRKPAVAAASAEPHVHQSIPPPPSIPWHQPGWTPPPEPKGPFKPSI